MRKVGIVIILIGSVLSIIPAVYALDLVYELRDELAGIADWFEFLAKDPPTEAGGFFASVTDFATDTIESALTACWIMVFCSMGAIVFSAIAARVRARVASMFVLLPLGIGAWVAYPLLGGEIRPAIFAYLTAGALTGAGALIVFVDPAVPAREGAPGE